MCLADRAIKDVRTGGVSIIWIEHVVHALLATVDRLLVLHAGKFIAEGDPQTVIQARRWRRSIWVSTPMPDVPLLESSAIDAFYGDFQALFDVSLSVGAGQVIAVIGANGAGKSTLLKTIAGLMHPHRGESYSMVPGHGTHPLSSC